MQRLVAGSSTAKRPILVLVVILCFSTFSMAQNALDKTKEYVIDKPAHAIGEFFDLDDNDESKNIDQDVRQKSAAPRDTECRNAMVEKYSKSGPPILVTMEDLQENPENYYGRTVSVVGEMHRTFTDNVFTIEDDDFWNDEDILVISVLPNSEVIVPLEGSIDEGKDVSVTGMVEPFDRANLECAYGPLAIESHEGASFTKKPVLIIDRVVTARLEPPVRREKPYVPEFITPPPAAPEPERTMPEPRTLPQTAGELPALLLVGLFSICSSVVARRRRAKQTTR